MGSPELVEKFLSKPLPNRMMSSASRAITRLVSGLLVGFVGGIATGAVAVVTMYGSLIRLVMTQSSSSPSINALINVFNSLNVLIAIGMGVTIMAALLQYLGFAELSKINSKYSPAKIGALLIPIGSITALPGLYLLINAMKELISTNQINSVPTLGIAQQQPATALIALIPSMILILVGGALSLVGLILLVIGYYRLGEDYGSDLIRIGAILYILAIIPYIGPPLSIAGFILMIIGLLQIRQRPANPPN